MMLTDEDGWGVHPTERAMRRRHAEAEQNGLTHKVTPDMAAGLDSLDRAQEAVRRGGFAAVEVRFNIPGAQDYHTRMAELRAKIDVLRSEDRNDEAEVAEQERRRLKVEGFSLLYGAGPTTLARLLARYEEMSGEAIRKRAVEQEVEAQFYKTQRLIAGRHVQLREPELVFARDDKSLIAAAIRTQQQMRVFVDSELYRRMFGTTTPTTVRFYGDDKTFDKEVT